MKLFSSVFLHELAPRKKGKKTLKFVLNHFHYYSHQLWLLNRTANQRHPSCFLPRLHVGQEKTTIKSYFTHIDTLHFIFTGRLSAVGMIMPHSDIQSQVKSPSSVVLPDSKRCCSPWKPYSVKKKYEPDRLSWPANTAKYKSSLLCLRAACTAWNNRQEITEGICQQCSWLGSINVPLACFSTQTLETNSSPIQGSCLDKRWWIPGAEAANRDFLPPLFYIYIILPETVSLCSTCFTATDSVLLSEVAEVIFITALASSSQSAA